jgi:hypothetical protein
VAAEVFVVGETETGKSNYLGSCWLAIDSGHSSLNLDGLPDDIEAVRVLGQHLLGGTYSKHTKSGSTTELKLNVSHRESGQSIGTLTLPDFSGEDCEIIITKRRWSPEWERAVMGATGLLVFIRGDKINPCLDWCEAQQLGAANLLDGNEPTITFPSDVVLVELLQMIAEARNLRPMKTQLNLGIVVSCWDSLPTDIQKATPAKYISENLKLLDQFLTANDGVFNVKVFGVSSTGGDLLDEDYKAKYLADPRSAGYVVIADSNGQVRRLPDVTIPINWVLTGPR